MIATNLHSASSATKRDNNSVLYNTVVHVVLQNILHEAVDQHGTTQIRSHQMDKGGLWGIISKAIPDIQQQTKKIMEDIQQRRQTTPQMCD